MLTSDPTVQLWSFFFPRYQQDLTKGRMTSPKRMNFWKSSKRPLTPPSFSENHVALFATKLRQKCVCSVWRDCCVLYDPISHEMHVVQQFNMVLPLNWLKTYPKKTLLYHFHAEKALFKVQNLQHKFLDWKCPPPPFWNFSENSSVLEMSSFPYTGANFFTFPHFECGRGYNTFDPPKNHRFPRNYKSWSNLPNFHKGGPLRTSSTA